MFRGRVGKRLKDLQLESRWCIFAQIKACKARIAWTVFFHGVVYTMMLIRLVVFSILPHNPPAALTKYRQVVLIPLESWEVAWLTSAINSLLVSISTRWNKYRYLRLIILGNTLLGLGPLCYGLWDNHDTYLTYISERDLPALSILFPYTNEHQKSQQQQLQRDPQANFALLQFYWICLSLQVHIYQMCFCGQLHNTWSVAKG